ncbi:MAG: hypothetical protein ABWY77_04800 [Acidimicrobiia bacterium]
MTTRGIITESARRPSDVVDAGLAALVASLPTSGWGLDQLWRTASRRACRAYDAAPAARSLDFANLPPDAIRRSRSAAIVGSAPSAKLARSEQWALQIDEMDVFALNHASAIAPHPVVCSIERPDLRGRQLALTPDQGVRFLEWAVRRAAVGGSNPLLVVRANQLDPATLEFVERFRSIGLPTYVALQAALPVRGRRGSESFARWTAQRDAPAWPVPGQPFLAARGGLGFLVTLCIALGYAEIVLFGVDLGSNEYFFDEWRDDACLAEFVTAMGPPDTAAHPTAQQVGDRPSVVGALVALDQLLMRPQGRKLVVANHTSLLHPGLALAEPG